ncbi:hypothetical protein GWN15_13580, partial [candidate division KSB1 bacterium]|nr:hypothetical protein [candidate division KSB1 bacterium]NIU92985.1 hypothetical protein [candidate division KSB1 bacterium]NIW69905.1 hypothetical protein [candidate division KSB1 bacterium]
EGSERYEREFERLQQLISVSNGDFLQQELQKLDREYQSDGEYFLHKGYFLADELGRHEEALEAFQQAVDITPADPFAVFNQAIALDKLGKKSEAQVTYKRTA